MEDLKVSQIYKRDFNAGYLMERYEPELFKELLNSLSASAEKSSRFRAMLDGRKQAIMDRQREESSQPKDQQRAEKQNNTETGKRPEADGMHKELTNDQFPKDYTFDDLEPQGKELPEQPTEAPKLDRNDHKFYWYGDKMQLDQERINNKEMARWNFITEDFWAARTPPESERKQEEESTQSGARPIEKPDPAGPLLPERAPQDHWDWMRRRSLKVDKPNVDKSIFEQTSFYQPNVDKPIFDQPNQEQKEDAETNPQRE